MNELVPFQIDPKTRVLILSSFPQLGADVKCPDGGAKYIEDKLKEAGMNVKVILLSGMYVSGAIKGE